MGDTDLSVTIMPTEREVRQTMMAIEQFRREVHGCLIKEVDYGVIPGTTKPTLLKPGAEKITKLLGLANESEIVERVEDWDKGLFHYVVRMKLTHLATRTVVASCLGEANSMEAKYRWRDAKRKCPECGTEAIIKGKEEYGGGWLCFRKQGGCGAKFAAGDSAIESQRTGRVENDDTYSQVNTILKMAEKRALVNAALSVGRLSDVFTQDIEDIPPSTETIAVETEALPDATGKPVPMPSGVHTLDLASEAQRRAVFAKAKEVGISEDTLKETIRERFGKTSTKELTKWEASALLDFLQAADVDPKML